MAECMLTTVDNPFNPFTQWDDWFAFDEQKGYHTCSYLARIADVDESMSDESNDEAIEDAMDEICRVNPLGIHRKITEDGQFVPLDLKRATYPEE